MTANTTQLLTEWFKIQEILGPEFRNNLPASVEAIKTERDELRQHLSDLRAALDYEETGSQKLIERNKELNVQLNLCIEALEELEDHDTERDPSEVRSIVRETLDQLRKLES